MSAIINHPESVDLFGSLGPDGVRRYKTRCKILVDSHLGTETLVLIDDVRSVQMSKTIKGAGQATFVLVPSENYLNLIFSNDYINIYFDIGDGTGWTRTFFGLVDRVEEEYVVGKEGKPNTSYKVVCSDFHKVFERTNVYFNPHLANREEFQNYDYAKANVAGLSLMTKGLVAGGAPPDIIQNVILQMMGFGTQFQLPPSYAPGGVQSKLRKKRARDVVGRLSPEDAEDFVASGYDYLKVQEKVREQVTATVEKFGKLASIEDIKKGVAEELGIQIRTGKEQISNPSQLIEQATDAKLREGLAPVDSARGLVGTVTASINRNQAELESTVAEDSYLIDILDLYTFVEKRAMDGYLFGQPVWQKQGTLLSILRTFSNEPINELFFDLRPLSAGTAESETDFRPVEGGYATIADDKRGNTEGGEEAGTTMIPAVIMREYPFATVQGLDLADVELLVRSNNQRVRVGQVPFGAIFADGPNDPGRHIVNIPNINVDDRATSQAEADSNLAEPTTLGYKHLDVAVISEGEIMKSTLGRSDADHYNLFEFYSDAVLGTDKRFYMKDVLPIITPIHILRNGLRPRTVTTRAARFSLEAVARMKGFQGDEAPEVADTGNKTENAVDDLAEHTGLLGLPVDSDPDNIVFFNGQQSDWGYRPKPRPGRTDGPQAWVFHQGIDISKKNSSTLSLPIPIKAIADGWVVHCVPDKGKAGYGNYVVLKHKFPEIKGFRYSTYAHLSSFHPNVLLGGKGALQSITPSQVPNFCAADEAPGVSGAKQKPKKVKKGDIIGYMGNTGTGYNPGVGFHLHFEITRRFAPRLDSVTRRIPFTEVPQSGPTPAPPAGFDPVGDDTGAMVAANQRSCDPVRFYSAFGQDFVGLINGGSSPSQAEEGPNEPDDKDMGDGSAEEQLNDPKSDVQEETGTQILEQDLPPLVRNRVDGGSTRRQILRWALLQDHWYQHNIEYLSGRIDMRGAPEIRVGYRLDIQERNMSFYVEGVNHTWAFPDSMKTNLQVSRGQPNNPYPLYVYPYIESLGATNSQRRNAQSRLANYFVTPDPIAIRRSLFLRGSEAKTAGLFTHQGGLSGQLGNNASDSLEAVEFDAETMIAEKYNEMVAPSGSYNDFEETVLPDNESARDISPTSSLSGKRGSGIPKPKF